MPTTKGGNLFIFCVSLFLLAPWVAKAAGPREYKNPDGSSVVILPVGKAFGDPDNESKIEFYSRQNELLCTLDYSSEDGEHGFGVVKAAWTPDGQYFVYSMTSSGGHQSWHAPTLFYSQRYRAIFDLDRYVEASGISKADFVLKAPNTVLTEAWRGKAVSVSFRLDKLTTGGRRSSRALACVDGKRMRPER
ncbi:MAG: hypothetical protein WCE61_10905 [Candidatus Acidiferrum sp.]